MTGEKTKKERAEDQKVEAFSAPKDLLSLAKKKAVEKGMTKSGFYRYALARELGYSEEDALNLSKFMPIARNNPRVPEGAVHYGEHKPGNHFELNTPKGPPPPCFVPKADSNEPLNLDNVGQSGSSGIAKGKVSKRTRRRAS